MGVETVVRTARVCPGETVSGTVLLRAGESGGDVTGLTLEIVTYWGTGSGDGRRDCVIHRSELLREYHLEAGEIRTVEFELPLSFETPLTIVADRSLPGMEVEIVTSVGIDEGRYVAATTPISVLPLPAQAEIHSALTSLGFRPHAAVLEDGWLRGLERELLVYQSVDFEAVPECSGINRVRVSLLAGEDGVEAIMESDPPSKAVYGSLYLDHSEVGEDDLIDAMREQLAKFGEGA
ncbi:sporulation protein [Nocardia yamanashiensis]|uniref:sporulation protein n=1 Tax=Nocardia yamanashiensis TaxID=209247 RepID=UPI0014719893|nr:sporulation protein [Nocardia yamanashiensis]